MSGYEGISTRVRGYIVSGYEGMCRGTRVLVLGYEGRVRDVVNS